MNFLPSPPLLNHTIPEVARTLRTSAANVYSIVKRGELVAIKFGRRTVVADSDLRDFIEKHRTNGGTG